MGAFSAMVGKLLLESRWLLLTTALLLGLLSFGNAYGTYRFEKAQRDDAESKDEDPFAAMRRRGFVMAARSLGGDAVDGSSKSLEIAFWKHPLFILLLCIWPIARGSAAVAGEVERGTLDVVLSRPIARSNYLGAHVATGLIGLAVLAAALAAGAVIGNAVHHVESPPSAAELFRAGAITVALGLTIFGYTLLLSTIDSVRWRPNLIGSALTLSGFILQFMAQIFSSIPSLEYLKKLDRLSIFKLYDPVGAALAPKGLPFNAGVLAAIGAASVAVGFWAFGRRDLPTNS